MFYCGMECQKHDWVFRHRETCRSTLGKRLLACQLELDRSYEKLEKTVNDTTVIALDDRGFQRERHFFVQTEVSRFTPAPEPFGSWNHPQYPFDANQRKSFV